ncbi:hypothetical protein [Paraburkholderia diazotrophica]|uniref:Uncharacterized protein n=1 Tax=Paraburkholderia diazotrophica TaxID=667676 RepID=A0A1H7DLJ9_9BURK|nr:hypothetical protein [Paraburkholderia diazotrophica]SEK02234.1 hypothetical protein SAMN05192539_103142 [Paraburkholderia diazotrophica]
MRGKAIVAGVLAVLICMLKYPHRLFRGFLWAEDGPIFILQAAQHGFRAIWIPYNGYLHAIPRLIAGSWTALSTPDHFIHGFAWTCTAAYFIIAYSLFCLSRRHFPSNWRGHLLSLSVAVLPFAVPQSGEIYFTITNLQWFFSPLLAFLVIDFGVGIDSPIRRWSAMVLALTGPFGVLLLPLAGVLWLSHRSRRLRPLLPYLMGCAMQLVSYTLTHGQETSSRISNYALTKDFPTSAIGEVFVPNSVDFFYQHQGVCLLATCGLLALALLNGIRATKLSLPLFIAAAVLWTIGVIRQGTPDMLIHWYGYGARYLFMPELCFGVGLLFAAVSGVLTIGRLAAITLLCTMVWKAPLPIVPHADDTAVTKESGMFMLRFPPARELQLNTSEGNSAFSLK